MRTPHIQFYNNKQKERNNNPPHFFFLFSYIIEKSRLNQRIRAEITLKVLVWPKVKNPDRRTHT